MPYHSLWALFVVALSCLWAGNSLGAEEARVTVFADKELGPVNRGVLGAIICGPKVYRYLGADWYPIFGSRGGGVWDPQRRKPEPEYQRLAQMAGIPIWRLSCDIEWTKLVGPVNKRPQFQFGLPEFLSWCEATGSQAVFIVYVWNLYNWPYYPDGRRDKPEGLQSAEFMASYAADLVEYLNAPNDGSNPNGGTDWAARRAQDGHPQPYHVRWFEFGNEEYGGADLKRKVWGFKGEGELAREYALRYLKTRAAMKAIDPRIKLGAVIQYFNPGDRAWSAWNGTILRLAGKEIDFGISHHYWPAGLGDLRKAAEAGAAVGTEIEKRLETLNRFVEQETGRTELPWAITEWTGAPFADSPMRFASSMANALAAAHHIAAMMRPANRVALATYASFPSRGMVEGYPFRGEELVLYAPFYVFQMYRQHFGDVLIEAKTDCGTWQFAGEFFDWGGVSVSPGKVPDLWVNAAKRKDGSVTLVVVNTNVDAPIGACLAVRGGQPSFSRGFAWSLVGPPEAMHLGSKPALRVVQTPIHGDEKGCYVTFPRYSVTAVELLR